MKIFTIFFCLYSAFIFSQNKIVKVEYLVTYNTEGPTARNAYLYFDVNKNISIFKEQYTKKNKVDSKSEVGGTALGLQLGSDAEDLHFSDYKKDSLFTIETFVKKPFYITEKIPKINWKLENEVKEVDSFILKKATCYFRGRNYIAWYSLEYPYQYGPWKFNGLPGLIFEISDETKRFNWQLKSISAENDIDVFKFTKKGITKITISEYVETQQNEYKTLLDNMAAKMPRGMQRSKREMAPRNGIELKYEWEE